MRRSERGYRQRSTTRNTGPTSVYTSAKTVGYFIVFIKVADKIIPPVDCCHLVRIDNIFPYMSASVLNLMDLIDAGYDLEYSESIRINHQGEEESLLTDWYLNREFTNSELRLLIDGLLFSRL